MRLYLPFLILTLCVVIFPHLSCLTLQQKKRKVNESVLNFVRIYSMRDSVNVTHFAYPPLFPDYLLKQMSTREFKRELNRMENSMSLFLDTMYRPTDTIFIYNGMKYHISP